MQKSMKSPSILSWERMGHILGAFWMQIDENGYNDMIVKTVLLRNLFLNFQSKVWIKNFGKKKDVII